MRVSAWSYVCMRVCVCVCVCVCASLMHIQFMCGVVIYQLDIQTLFVCVSVCVCVCECV